MLIMMMNKNKIATKTVPFSCPGSGDISISLYAGSSLPVVW